MESVPKRKVLVVGGEPRLTTIIEKALGQNFMMESVSGSDKNLKRKILNYAPDIIVLDVEIPPLSGIKLSLRIRRWAPEIPILALSTWETQENTVKSLDLSSDTYLSQPMSSEELRAKIELILSRI